MTGVHRSRVRRASVMRGLATRARVRHLRIAGAMAGGREGRESAARRTTGARLVGLQVVWQLRHAPAHSRHLPVPQPELAQRRHSTQPCAVRLRKGHQTAPLAASLPRSPRGQLLARHAQLNDATSPKARTAPASAAAHTRICTSPYPQRLHTCERMATSGALNTPPGLVGSATSGRPDMSVRQ